MGFDTKQFVEKVDENLICGICLDVLEDPWHCKDGHTFCKVCITRCLENKQICPVGKNELKLESLGRSLLAKNMVENLEVYCHLPESGQAEGKDAEKSKLKCGWTGKLQALAKHRETCPFQQVQCPNENCNTNMQRRELEDHDKICEYKILECQKCREVLLRLELSLHKDHECPEEMVPCRNGCRSQETRQINEIKRVDLDDHLNNICSKAILDCPFKDQGCSVQVERQHVEKHVQDNMAAHMMLLAKQCSSLTKQNSSLAKENEQLKEELNNVKKNEDLLRTYIWKIKNFREVKRSHQSSYIRSPTFWLCGYSWYLKLNPKNITSVTLCLDDGCGSRDLTNTLVRNADTFVAYRLTVASQRIGTEDFSKERRHSILPNSFSWNDLSFAFYMTSDDEAYCDEDGNSIIKCTIHLDYGITQFKPI